MRQIEQATRQVPLEAVVESLARVGEAGESLAEVAHDARNMVAALGLYCDLLVQPGVLASRYIHYGSELRLVASASQRLVQRLVALESQEGAEAIELDEGTMPDVGWLGEESSGARQPPPKRWELTPAEPVDNLAAELLGSRNLLAALAGPAIKLTVETEQAELPVRITREGLTRILVNLVKNAAEAMPAGGTIRLTLRESPFTPPATPRMTLTIEDNGPGIPDIALGNIFQPGFSTRSMVTGASNNAARPRVRRGLGLSITRSIVKAAGGHIHAANRDPSGACFQIDLPVRSR